MFTVKDGRWVCNFKKAARVGLPGKVTLEHKLERDAEINPEGKMGVEHRRDGSR